MEFLLRNPRQFKQLSLCELTNTIKILLFFANLDMRLSDSCIYPFYEELPQKLNRDKIIKCAKPNKGDEIFGTIRQTKKKHQLSQTRVS